MSTQTAFSNDTWPSLPLEDWSETCTTLQLWTQIVGKIRLVQSPWLNHSWHVTLYLTARGLTTMPIAHGTRTFQIDFDFVAHQLTIQVSDSGTGGFALEPQSVQAFYKRLMKEMDRLMLHVRINTTPNEVIDPIPFDQDRDTLRLRSGICRPVLAHTGSDRTGFQAVSRPLYRQMQSGAFFLGGCGSGRYALFRASGAIASWRNSGPAG